MFSVAISVVLHFLHTSGRSLTLIKRRIDPSTDPGGTLRFMAPVFDWKIFMETNCFNYSFRRPKNEPLNPDI